MSNVHPACALIVAVGLLFGLLLVKNVIGVIYLLILFLIVAVSVRIKWRFVARGLVRIWPLFFITLCLHLVLSDGFSVSFADFPRIAVNSVAIQTASLFTGRLVLIVAVSVTLFSVYSADRMAKELGRWLVWLPVGRKSAAQVELLLALSLRFVPLLSEEYRRLQLALVARGGALSGRFAKIYVWRQLMFPLMVNAFRRADQVALALQARGYDPAVLRTSYSHRRVTAAEWSGTAVIVGACFVAPWI